MAFLGGYRSRRLARRADLAFETGGFSAAAAVLNAVPTLGAAPWAHLAVFLYNRDLQDESEKAIRRALDIEPERGDALIFLAELLVETGRSAEAIESYQRLLVRYPAALAQALALAKLYLETGDLQAARGVLQPLAGRPSHELHLLLAKVYCGLGEHEPALALLAPLVRQMKLELHGLVFGAARDSLFGEYQEAMRLHDDAYAILHGREQVIEAAHRRGDLDARAGVNYRLLGEARMVEAPAWAADIRLPSVEEGWALGQSLVSAGDRSRGLCHQGLARLREGRLDEARRLFDRARQIDDDNFAAYLGLGAALDLTQARAFERVPALLPSLGPLPPGLEQVVVDWPSLTEIERHVVAAVSAPLASLIPRIAAAGAVVRLLPIDVRLADLPEMQHDDGPEEDEDEDEDEDDDEDREDGHDALERFEDHRCLEGITGAATPRLCASKIEELLDLSGERDSVFAHELAHLAHFHAPEPVQQRIEDLYAAAVKHEHVITTYQTTNSAEFFAVAYTDYLAHTYQLPSRRELDDEGVVEETFALFRALG